MSMEPYGEGLLVNGKTAGYYNIAAASYGLQAGIQPEGPHGRRRVAGLEDHAGRSMKTTRTTLAAFRNL